MGNEVSEAGKQHFLYLIGVPGCGKTTLFNAVFGDLDGQKSNLPFKLTAYPRLNNSIRGLQLGNDRDNGYGGTDSLPMNAQPKVQAALLSNEFFGGPMPRAVVGEGDRLASDKFFRALKDWGWTVTVAYLYCPENIANMRREGRGSTQDATWLKGRRTKVERLAGMWVHPNWFLDASLPVLALKGKLETHPAVRIIRGEN